MKVLIADDAVQIQRHLSELLVKEGYQIIIASNGNEALKLYRSEKPDFLCLDIMMPDISGYDVCREIRRKDAETPILFLSSKTEPIDKTLGLELGADDYLNKPFDARELIARIRAITRRCISKQAPEKKHESFKMRHVIIYPNQLRANVDGEIVDLSLREVKILTLLNSKRNEVVSRDDLLDVCWGKHIMPESRTVDFHISKLRKRIEKDPNRPQIIQTVHGAGYRFEGC